jgi:ABC-type amino acid transport substrate-binding protein
MLAMFIGLCGPGYTADTVELKTEFQETEPKYLKNSDGSFGGLCVDLLRLIEQKSKYRFKYPQDFVPTKRLHQNLENRQTDVHCGLALSAEREQVLRYGVPLYTVQLLVAVRADDPIHVQGLDDIRRLGEHGRILTPMGTATYDYLVEQGGLLVDDGGKTPDKNLEKLESKRGRFFFYQSLNLLYEIHKAKNQGKFKVLPASFRDYDHWMVFSKALDDAIVNDILEVISAVKATPEYQEIVDRYLKVE